MDVLTRERAKPALPFAGVYQLVDFPMSNLRHSGIEDVWLSVQYQANSLEEQVANGRSWELDRSRGGFRLLVRSKVAPRTQMASQPGTPMNFFEFETKSLPRKPTSQLC